RSSVAMGRRVGREGHALNAPRPGGGFRPRGYAVPSLGDASGPPCLVHADGSRPRNPPPRPSVVGRPAPPRPRSSPVREVASVRDEEPPAAHAPPRRLRTARLLPAERI